MVIYLFVDGSNLYAGQYELSGPRKFLDFGCFIGYMEKILCVTFNKIYFYASYSPKTDLDDKEQIDYLRNEGLFYKSARKLENLSFFKGHRSTTSGKEKGVDVALASDMVRFSCENRFDRGYLMTGDADFQHCIEIALEKEREINIVAIENRISHRLAILYHTSVFYFIQQPIIFTRRHIQIFKINSDCVKNI
jgi:uncharacterized LabA/DUF88 family protein